MRISFSNRKLGKLANSDREATKAFGKPSARKLRLRLDDLDAAASLEDMRHLPAARCHELKHDRKGELAVDLHGGLRLIFKPDHEPPPAKPDGGLDWTQVTAITVTAITDYHD